MQTRCVIEKGQSLQRFIVCPDVEQILTDDASLWFGQCKMQLIKFLSLLCFVNICVRD